MSVLVAVGLILAVGVWGYLQSGDVLYVMNRLSAKEIAQYAANAGFSGDDLTTAVAVALAESAGDPKAVGDVSLGGSIGLWQIYTRAHPEFANVDLTDPTENAAAAYSVYVAAGRSFTPWSTFKYGRYMAFLGQAQSGVNA